MERLEKFDLDQAIRRKPDLILMDDLACENPRGSRHSRRYQDIRELLKAGISVYTTVSAQNIESLNDIVTAITFHLRLSNVLLHFLSLILVL